MTERVLIGDEMLHGKVCAVGMVSGEQYVWTLDSYGVVRMFPALVIVEERNA